MSASSPLATLAMWEGGLAKLGLEFHKSIANLVKLTQEPLARCMAGAMDVLAWLVVKVLLLFVTLALIDLLPLTQVSLRPVWLVPVMDFVKLRLKIFKSSANLGMLTQESVVTQSLPVVTSASMWHVVMTLLLFAPLHAFPLWHATD